jgi:hypothetical protein
VQRFAFQDRGLARVWSGLDHDGRRSSVGSAAALSHPFFVSAGVGALSAVQSMFDTPERQWRLGLFWWSLCLNSERASVYGLSS